MRYFLVSALLVSLLSYPSAASPKRANELESKSKNLVELKQSLKEKKREKERYLQVERNIKAELQKINKELNRLEKQGVELRTRIRAAERNLADSEKGLKTAVMEKMQWSAVHSQEAGEWYMQTCAYPRLTVDPVAEHMRRQALTLKKLYVTDAVIKQAASQRAVAKWENAQKQLQALKAEQVKMLKEQGTVKDQKKEILKSTVGRRVEAEDEIKKLSESAKALEQLMAKILREKARKAAVRPPKVKERRPAVQERRNSLPWPVKGDVVVKFGKSKHPDLDTIIISNGIRIKAAPSAEIKAVTKGEVIFCGEFRSYGQMIIVDHGGGFCSIYGQLGRIVVKEGQKITEASIIGMMPAESQPVFYFEVRQDNQAEDPLLWLK